jgi:hypothetical protein
MPNHRHRTLEPLPAASSYSLSLSLSLSLVHSHPTEVPTDRHSCAVIRTIYFGSWADCVRSAPTSGAWAEDRVRVRERRGGSDGRVARANSFLPLLCYRSCSSTLISAPRSCPTLFLPLRPNSRRAGAPSTTGHGPPTTLPPDHHRTTDATNSAHIKAWSSADLVHSGLRFPSSNCVCLHKLALSHRQIHSFYLTTQPTST